MKLRYLIVLSFLAYTCQREQGNLSNITVIHKQSNSTYNVDILLKNKVVQSYSIRDLAILGDTIESLNSSLLRKHYSRDDCSWEKVINAINLEEKFVDIQNFNFFLKSQMKLKKMIAIESEEGYILSKLIIDANFPESISSFCITNYELKWKELKNIYSKDIADSTSLDKISNFSKYSDKFTVSDYCSYNFNKKIISNLDVNDKKNFYVCVFTKILFENNNRIGSSEFDRDDLLFEFEQYLDSAGFLQIKKKLLNPYSFSRIRSNRFE